MKTVYNINDFILTENILGKTKRLLKVINIKNDIPIVTIVDNKTKKRISEFSWSLYHFLEVNKFVKDI